jgi:hypothetical protein
VLTSIPVQVVLRWGWMATAAYPIVWDFEGYLAISVRQVQLVRDAGALAQLPLYLSQLGTVRPWMGDLAGTASLVAETDSVAAAIGSRIAPFTLMMLRALQGGEAEASAPITTAIQQAAAGGQGIAAAWAHWTASVLCNGLGRYAEAAAAARQAASESIDPFVPIWALPEFVEAAARAGDAELARDALGRLAQTTQPASTGRSALRRAAARCWATGRLPRAHRLYGEWLRRDRRRTDARAQLRAAHDMFDTMGMEAFASRAAHELRATGETVHKRTVSSPNTLTAQRPTSPGLHAALARLGPDGQPASP